jgi:hypothetical protein
VRNRGTEEHYQTITDARRNPSPSPLPKGEGFQLLHLDIYDLAAKGAQDLLNGWVLNCCLASLFL